MHQRSRTSQVSVVIIEGDLKNIEIAAIGIERDYETCILEERVLRQDVDCRIHAVVNAVCDLLFEPSL